MKTINPNKKLFIPYFPFGYPTIESSLDIIETLAKNGADAIEIGMSFSDPLADGPVIQHATQIALNNGVTVKKTLDAVAELRARGVDIPIFLMGYYNPILAFGLKNFTDQITQLEVAGLIIPDLPLEESGDLTPLLGKVSLVQMIAPTTPPDRLSDLAKHASGFIYLVSMTGITGSESNYARNLGDLVQTIKHYTEVPICVGFGVSTFEKAKTLSILCDGIVVGTRMIQEVERADDKVAAAAALARGFAGAIARK